LTFLYPSFFRFRYSGNIFLHESSGEEPFKQDVKNFQVYMRFRFEKVIREIQSNQIKIERDGNYSFILRENRKGLINKGKPFRVRVILDD